MSDYSQGHDTIDKTTTITANSDPIKTTRISRQDLKTSLYLYDVVNAVGSVQGMLSDDTDGTGEAADASTNWKDVDGGDLENFLDGICTVMDFPFDWFRIQVTSGSLKFRILPLTGVATEIVL